MSIHEALADTGQRGKLLLAEAGIHANLFDLRFGEPGYPAGRQLALNYPVHLVHAFEQVIEQFIFHQSTSLRLISGFSFALACRPTLAGILLNLSAQNNSVFPW